MFASWRKHFSIVLLLVMGMAVASAAQAVAPPNIITYQGRVLNTNGVSVSNTSLSMKFFLYTAVTGGTCLWSNSSADCNSNVPASTTARSVSLTTGLFTQNLGDTGDSFAAIASTIFGDNAAVYLEVDIAGETLTPRRRLTAAPYALNAQTLDGLSSADFDLDRVYDNDSGSALAIDGASGLTFTSSVAANFTVNLASTGDFVIQDNGTAFATFNDSGNVAFTGDLSVLGDDITMGTNTLGALLVADGTNFNPVVLSGDATISAAGALAIAVNSVALTTDTTGNYVASIADSGNSTVTVVNGSAEGGAVTLNVIDVNCTDCLGATEISDIYLLNSGDTITSNLTFSNGTTDSPNATFSPATGTSWLLYVEDAGDDFQILTNTASTETLDILNGGAGVINVTVDGGMTLGGDLTITGDDLFMTTNNAGYILVGDNTNYNPVALSGDATLASTGALSIAANSVALSTDTTGNYVATLADAGGSDFTIANSGSEGAAVTIDLANDAVDWDEIVDAMTLDASTSITMDGTEDFSIVNGGTGGVIVNLTSNGDFMVQDGSQAYFTVNDDSTIDIISTATTGDTLDITANSLTTAAAIDLDASHAPTAGGTVTAVDFGLTNAATTSAATYRGLSLSFTNNPTVAGNTEYLLNLSNVATANTTDNAVAAMIRIDNADTSATGSTVISDGLLVSVSGAISGGIADAIDASDANITNALNFGANTVLGTTGNIDMDNFDVVGATGNVTSAGTISAADFTCTDCLDFTELSDTLALDANTSITLSDDEYLTIVNGGTGDVEINLTSSGDFVLLDNSSDFIMFNDSGVVDFILNSSDADAFDITANSLTTAAAIDLDAMHAPTAGGTVTAVDFGLTNAATTSAATYRGLSLSFTNNPSVASNTEYLLNLSNAATANTTDNAVAAMIRIDNADTSATGSTVISDGILVSVSGAIAGGIADAIDVSDANITNALNFGVNTVLGTTGNIDMDNFDVVGATGNVTLGGDLTISGDDLTMGTNTSGFLLVADGTNFNPVALSSDATISSTGALTIAANAIALSTDTTGNYIATLADAGGGDFTVTGSGSEGAAVTIALAADAWDFADFEDTLDLDAATDINLGANLFSIDLDSTGDFAIRDGTTNVALFEDDSTIDITFPTAAFMTIDASTTANTNTTGVIDLNVSAGDAAVDALNIALVQNNGATAGTQATGLELSLEGNDGDGDMFGIRVTSTATTNAGAGTYDALLVLTNNENTSGAVTDAIRITSGAGTAGSITTGLDFDTTDITTDIEMQNNLTISNDDNNDLTFTENSVSLNIDFAEASSTYIHTYSATGLVYETDQNFRIDAGDSLPTSLVDGTDIELRPEDDVFFNLSAISAVRIDGASTDSQETGGALDIDVDTTTASNVGIDLNYQVVDDAAATVETMTALNILLDQYDVSGNTTRGLFIQQRAVTATTSGNALDAGIVIDNADTVVGAGDTAAAMTDAIRITGTGTGAITTGLDFDTPNIVTDIELQNAETISNDSDGKIAFGVGGSDELQLTSTELAPVADGGLDLGVSAQPFGDLYLSGGQLFANNAFDIDIDDNTASAFTISEGATNYLAFTTSNTGETATLGNSGLDSLTITTDNTAATDVGITGGLTVTSGATHNSFTVTSSADTETGAVVTVNSLTTGKGLSVTSTATGFTSGTLLDIDYTASGSLSAKTISFNEMTSTRENTATAGTLSDDYDLARLIRSSTQNGAGGAFSSAGSVLYVENVVAATAGTITDTANGIEVEMDEDGTGHGMIITMGTVASPAENGVNNQGLVIDVNETASADAVFLIRSDADGVGVDTEFRIDNDGDFQYDGTASTPAGDLAEVYPSAQALAPGDLVALDSAGSLKIVKTTQPFQGGLFGAISTKPAIRMGAEVIGYDVALIGRIPLKVSGEAGAIAVGDPLTASSTVGHAMKATRAGMIVGYALEAFDGTSTGVINAFIDVGWFAGNVIGTDGLSTILTDAVVVAPLGIANANAPTFDSFGLSLRGSAWNGNEAAAVEMMLQNVVSAPDDYRLSVRNTAESEVAYITNEGTMRIAGDMIVGGHLYPSDRGVPQTEKYIYYDGSAGPAGDFMRTNAKGWGTGSYDFAEMFPSVEKLIAGELVAFAPSGQAVRRATGVAGERVAGIVSTRPGFLAGENVEDSYPIALAGRVPTKVSAKNGDIVVGDPLTISDSPGVAMKATNAGQIVGYALESYTAADSDNLILAFVNVGYWSGGPQTVTIVQNVASQAPSGAQNVSALNMSGNIFLATNEILSIGRLEGMAASWSIERDGTIKTQALVKTVIESYQGTKVETIAVTSPEAVITLTGTAKLVEGKAEVRFEDVLPEFNDVISAIAPVRVIVTPSGPVSLYVSEKDQNHFVVQRFVGEADVEFDWMVTGYRKGFEPEEAEEASPADEVSDLFVPSVPLDLSAPDLLEPEAQIQEEPATPESPEETIVDPVTDDDGGAIAEEPSEVVDDQIIDPPEEPTAAE